MVNWWVVKLCGCDHKLSCVATGWTQPETDDAHMEKWNRMATSLHCFGDHLKFRSLGSGASQLEVEQGKVEKHYMGILYSSV